MDPVSLFMFLLVGLIAGYLANKVTDGLHGLTVNLVIGVAGAMLGGILAGIAGVKFYGLLGHMVVATLGAVLVIVVWRRVRA